MSFLNYHHLFYFWSVARHGGLAKASERLNVTPQTISGQIRTFEKAIGEKLFDRQHRNLRLTKFGEQVYERASGIFALGQDLQSFLSGEQQTRERELVVGVANALPKFVVYHLLEPAMHLDTPTHLICHEDKAERLLAELAIHHFDVVLSDTPVPPNISVRAYNHLLGKSAVLLMGTPELIEKYKDDFPRSLNNAPFLLPTRDTALRKSMDKWFHKNRVRPQIIAEHEDSALLKAFGEAGSGLFPVSLVVLEDVQTHYKSQPLGTLEGVEERFYAITIEKHVQHPAVSAICQAAREVFFAKGVKSEPK